MSRVDPQMAADEATTLVEFVDYFRDTIVIKIDGLTDEQSRWQASTPSTLSLLGLLRHLTEVERFWFRRVFMGEDVEDIYCTDDAPDGDLEPPDDATIADALAAWTTEVDLARGIVAAATSLDQLSIGRSRAGQPNLRWILVHLVEEYARHCGHADLIREAVDDQTGD